MLGVKGSLLLASGIVLAALSQIVPIFRQYPHYLLWAWLWALGFGMRPIWFFQGNEKMRLTAIIDIGCRVFAATAVFFIVRSPEDGWKVLAMFACANLLSSTLNIFRLYRRLPFQRPRWKSTWATFRMGWNLFVFRGAVSLYTTANPFVLGLLLPTPELVAPYGTAERIARAVQGLLNPLSQAFYPRISVLVGKNRARAAKFARLSLALMVGVGVAMAIALAAAAPLGIWFLTGETPADAVMMLRLLAVVIPLVAISNVLGIQWMLPLGMDKTFNAIIIGASLLNLAMAVTLVPLMGAMGMVWAVVTTETLVVAGLYILLRWRKLDPVMGIKEV